MLQGLRINVKVAGQKEESYFEDFYEIRVRYQVWCWKGPLEALLEIYYLVAGQLFFLYLKKPKLGNT